MAHIDDFPDPPGFWIPRGERQDRPAMSSELSKRNAEHELARAVERKLEEHWRRFGEQEMPFSYPNPEALCVPVMQRACRMFWQKHSDLWPRFVLSGTGGISIDFRRIRR